MTGTYSLADLLPESWVPEQKRESRTTGQRDRELHVTNLHDAFVGFSATLTRSDSCFLYVIKDQTLVLHSRAAGSAGLPSRIPLADFTNLHSGYSTSGALCADGPLFNLFVPMEATETYSSVALFPVHACGALTALVINLQKETTEYSNREISLISSVGAIIFAETYISALERQIRELIDKAETRKSVRRAQALLQEQLGITEQGAYLALQRESRKRRTTLHELSQTLITNAGATIKKPQQTEKETNHDGFADRRCTPKKRKPGLQRSLAGRFI